MPKRILDVRTDTVTKLCRRRWCTPVMAILHRERGAKFVTLCHALDAQQKPIRESLDWLIDAGWVIPNPGYGHPLRPEYVLTPEGEALGPGCARIWNTLQKADAADIGLRRWTLPVLATVSTLSPARFGGVADRLTPITNRALSLALGDLSGAGWVARRVDDAWPPTTRYEATSRGSGIVKALAALRPA